MEERRRRSFTPDHKQQAVKLVLSIGRSVTIGYISPIEMEQKAA
jgi:hypothetical protein